MKQPNQTQLLDLNIAALKIQQQSEFAELKQQFQMVAGSLNPKNLIYKSFRRMCRISIDQEAIFQTALSLIGGYLSKKIVVGKSGSIFKKAIGSLLQLVITNFLLHKKQITTSS